MLMARQFADSEGHLSLPALCDAVSHVLSQLGLTNDDDASATALSKKAHSPLYRSASNLGSAIKNKVAPGFSGGSLSKVAELSPREKEKPPER